jgi:hypothetical protein
VIFVHDFFNPPLHHAEVLLGVDVLGLSLILHIPDFANIALFLRVTIDAVINACGRPGRLVEEILKMEKRLIIDGVVFGEGDLL